MKNGGWLMLRAGGRGGWWGPRRYRGRWLPRLTAPAWLAVKVGRRLQKV